MSESAETPVQTIQTRNRGWGRFLAVALLFHIPLFIYPVLRLCHWLDLNAWLTSIIFLPLVSSQIVSRVYLRNSRSDAVLLLRRVFDLWLGISPIVLGLLLVAEVCVPVFNVAEKTAAWWVINLSLVIGVAGFIAALSPIVRNVRLTSAKIAQPLRFVQLSDVHVGSRSSRFLDQVMRKVNQLDAQFLCITGDFIDARGVTEEELGSLRSFGGPVYFCIGNHEKYEDLDDIVQRLSNLGVTVLRNRAIAENGVQFIGIDDMEDAMQVSRQLARIDLDRESYVILLYHRPRGLEAAAAAGVDLMLSGHTHNGQIVPFNLIVKRVFKQMRGLYHHGQTALYVNSGTGTWGPIMRLGTRSEITLIEVVPASTGSA
jgi:predicted MPP superfamily phosphohydrolase